ncbi:hypothetical protein jhhlp_002705 [Lomentospora prolificans]|uniref:Uncharacterized protein n=1 Tax=Lomentospora prolificans TaxID=41688 RepID=A0A2N3NEP0_9PEZI|nr:hypothetical protein jhhlp_002705 [Lomentospora prolificans]
MDSHAAKRRRTSPRTSVPIPAGGETGATTADTSTATDAPNSQSPRKKRPDFASPTKASLSRHNPEILARRRRSRQQQQQQEEEEQAQATNSKRTETTRPNEQPASTPGSPDSDISLSDFLSSRLGSVKGMTGKPRQSPVKPIPFSRPFPPPGPEGEEELVDPFKRRPRIRRSNVPEEPVEEPELPPTPSQLGIEDPAVTTPPQGIHTSSSPTKRRMANKDRRAKAIPMKKSPLKKQYVAPVVDDEPEEPAPDALANPQRETEGNEIVTHPARGVEPDEEIRRKEKYLAELLAEEENLWSDLNTISDLGREWAMQGEATKLVAFIKKHPKVLDLPEPDRKPSAQTEISTMLQMAMNPAAFLPFSKPTIQPSPAPEPGDEEPLPSHLPVQMTAKQELPYLQILTPFTFTSHNIPLTTADMKSYVQRRDISILAADAPHLFSSRISLVVDLSDFSINDLKVPRLEPAARRELGPFIEDVLTRTDRAMAKNVSLITWAMGEWYRLAVKRAQFWTVLARELSDAKRANGRAEKLWKQRAVQYNREVGNTIDDDMAEEDEDLSAGDIGGDMGRAAMTARLGIWGEDELMMRVGWKISFDWTGDARSRVTVAVGMPGRWHNADRNGVLAKIPRIFDEYVRGTNDVMAAVRRVIALVGYDADVPELRKVMEA